MPSGDDEGDKEDSEDSEAERERRRKEVVKRRKKRPARGTLHEAAEEESTGEEDVEQGEEHDQTHEEDQEKEDSDGHMEEENLQNLSEAHTSEKDVGYEVEAISSTSPVSASHILSSSPSSSSCNSCTTSIHTDVASSSAPQIILSTDPKERETCFMSEMGRYEDWVEEGHLQLPNVLLERIFLYFKPSELATASLVQKVRVLRMDVSCSLSLSYPTHFFILLSDNFHFGASPGRR